MGTLSAPFWCLCQKLSLSPLYFNKTLLHKSSERSSLVSGPRLNSSPPGAKNPGVFTWFNNNLSKRSVFIPIPKKGNAKECSNCCTIHSSHTLAKECSKFSKLGFNSMWTENVRMFKLNLEKAEEPEIKLPNSVGSSKKKENSRKHLLLLHWVHRSFWLCGSQQTREKSSRDGNARPPDPPPEKTVGWSRNNS